MLTPEANHESIRIDFLLERLVGARIKSEVENIPNRVHF